jgi:hypothetical protein
LLRLLRLSHGASQHQDDKDRERNWELHDDAFHHTE